MSYEPQHGEESFSTEQLSYEDVAQGRIWYKLYDQKQKILERKESCKLKMSAKIASKAAYAQLDPMVTDSLGDEEDFAVTDTPARQICSSSSNSSSITSVIDYTSLSSITDSSATPLTKPLRKYSIADISAIMTSNNMPDELIKSFEIEKVDGLTLSMLDNIDDLISEYIPSSFGIKGSKIKALWSVLAELKSDL